MTDGIIQEVINREIEQINNQLTITVDRYRNKHEYLLEISVLEDIRQKLIEKIKQELNDHQSCLDDGCTLREHLIGDNE